MQESNSDIASGSGSDVAPRTRFARAKTPKQSSLSTKRSEYTVNFEPGSIGLKLEPVLKNGQKEFGCRVMKLMTNGKGSTSPSQASKSGKINVGDVLTAINGKTVTSKSYKEIVSMLTSSDDRGVTFRIPRSPAPVMPTTPASTIRSSSENAATGNVKSQREGVMKTPPARSDKSSIGEESTTVFSPSFVNRMTRSTVKDASVFYTPRHKTKPLSSILSTVMKSVAPTISTTKPMHAASALSKQISQVFAGNSSKETEETIHMKMELLNELSQAKASLGEQEKNMLMMTKIMENIHREKVVVQSEKNILKDELSIAQNAQAVSESLLHEKGEEFKTVEDEKSIKLERAQCNLEDTTARVNALAKQNGLLRAQYEQLKVKSNSKERDFARQLTKATKEAKEAENLKKKASLLEKRLVEKERKLALVSKELTDRTSFAEKAANGMNEKDAVLIQMRSTVEEMKYHAEEVGTSHQTTVTKLELKLTEMSEELNAQATESGQIHEENAHTHSMLEGASMRNEEISKKMEEERVQHQAVMHTFKNDHEEQLKNEREKSEKALVQLDEERVQHQDVMHTFKNDHEEQLKEEREKSEKALVQLSDSKQIIESTTSELHARLFALQLEFDKKSQSEKQLLLQMSERERDLRRENEMIHENLIEANSNKSTIDNKFQQSQQHLSETSQKVETLEIDLGQWQQKNACLVSEREYLTTKLEENELEYRDLLASTTQNKSLQDALMTESHDLRLELSELKRSSDTNEQHLANQIQKQKTEFDIELSELKKSVEIKEQQLINQIQQRDAGFDHEKLKLDEQIADSKAFTQTLMTQLETESNKSSGVYNQKVSKLESDLTEIEDIVQKLKQDKEQIADSLQLCVEERDALACDNAKLAKRLESSQEDAKRWMQTSRDLSYRSAAEKQSLETKLQRTEEDLVLSKTAIDEEASNGALMMQVIELEDKLRYSKSEAEQQKEFLQDELTIQ
eukprot:scaffold2385_cov193-Chaetoceros_neogracile.AAC.1